MIAKGAQPRVVRQGARGVEGGRVFPIKPCPATIKPMANHPEPVLKLNDRFQISGWQHKLKWQPFCAGVDIYRLYENGPSGPTAALLRFHPGGRVPLHEHVGYEHIFMLAGEQVDEVSKAEAGALIVNPPGTSHSIVSETGCIVLAIYEKPVKFLAAGQTEHEPLA